jgi:hypothetical protein
MTPSATLVVGCSEQRPNELRAYYLMGTSTEGAVLLNRHGKTYSAAPSEVCDYPALLERMLGVVLPSFPSSLRERARRALISRWNRDWGVDAEGLVQTTGPAANDNASGFATDPIEPSTSPSAPLRSRLECDGSFKPRTTDTANWPSAAHG